MGASRLDKLISGTFGLTRKQARLKIAAGEVQADGKTVRDPAAHFDESVSLVCAGQSGRYEPYVYIMMNKPKGVISASRDKRAKTALDLLPPEYKRRDLFVAGRLDKDATGFLLITNDGMLAHDILAPRKHISKTYLVTLRNSLRSDDIKRFAEGMRLGKERCRPAILEILDTHKARVILEEGKFHQIKRMFSALDNEVVALHRQMMGRLKLDATLASGQARYITPEELYMLKESGQNN